MAQTYTQIQRKIEALQMQAEKLKYSEVSGVIERIKTAISHYGLTPEQLFGTSRAGARKAPSSPTKASDKTSGARSSTAAAYTDGAGNSWRGRGPRPRWLRDALAAGKSLHEFSTTPMPTKSAASAKKVASKRKAKQQYRDQAGNQWSGFGPRPGWLKDALAAGKMLKDFAGPSQD